MALGLGSKDTVNGDLKFREKITVASWRGFVLYVGGKIVKIVTSYNLKGIKIA